MVRMNPHIVITIPCLIFTKLAIKPINKNRIDSALNIIIIILIKT